MNDLSQFAFIACSGQNYKREASKCLCRDAVGRFPDYPAEEDGGSLMIFKEKDPAEVEAALKALVSMACCEKLCFVIHYNCIKSENMII